MLADRIISFHKNLEIKQPLPRGIHTMNPYQDDYVFGLCKQFFRKYYSDHDTRTLLLGINPGRFGSGATGISFTDPIRLQQNCAIPNTLAKKPELSSDFIYRMIEAFGGPSIFYRKYFISAVSPLGFTMHGKNINYYDHEKLQEAVTPFVVKSITTLCATGIDGKVCYCVGEGKNLKFLERLNRENHWFEAIVPLPHPRFIMQYRRKHLDEYIRKYLEALG